MKPHKKEILLFYICTPSQLSINIRGKAGVDTDQFKAHSARGAASYASLKLGVCAGWCPCTTFSPAIENYFIPDHSVWEKIYNFKFICSLG